MRLGTKPICLIAALWCAAVAVGVLQLARYETTSGASAPAPGRWPSASALRRGEGFTVVMFLHPECPCSRASLAELEAIASTSHATYLLVFSEAGGESWDRAGEIGATRVVDRSGEAMRFGAKTSGHVVVFDSTGARRFEGGITGSRGHVGNNVGRTSIVKILAGNGAEKSHAVFGCALEAS